MGVVREAFELDLREPCQVGEIRAGLAGCCCCYVHDNKGPREGGREQMARVLWESALAMS